jgi:repressor of nif and glnA expression
MAHLDTIDRKQIEILRVLSEHDKPVGSFIIKEELRTRGIFLSDRTIRYYLQLLDEKKFTTSLGKNGRLITSLGLEEISRTLAFNRIGFVITRFLSLAYETTYDLEMDTGLVAANVFIMDKMYHDETYNVVRELYNANLLPAPYIKVLKEGSEYKDISVPRGKIALLTVCDLTVDGVLIHAGIPLLFKYGGLVQVINYKPIRFVELISYEGTTIPPLEVFVYRNLTSITKILKTGSGMLPANIREIPIEARARTSKIFTSLKNKGWAGFLAFGEPNENILGIPVGMDRFGISMIGGISPGAAMMERGIKVDTVAPHCLIPLEEMDKI